MGSSEEESQDRYVKELQAKLAAAEEENKRLREDMEPRLRDAEEDMDIYLKVAPPEVKAEIERRREERKADLTLSIMQLRDDIAEEAGRDNWSLRKKHDSLLRKYDKLKKKLAAASNENKAALSVIHTQKMKLAAAEEEKNKYHVKLNECEGDLGVLYEDNIGLKKMVEAVRELAEELSLWRLQAVRKDNKVKAGYLLKVSEKLLEIIGDRQEPGAYAGLVRGETPRLPAKDKETKK